MDLVCPRDHVRLRSSGDSLTCGKHSYPVVGGIPIFLLEESAPEYWSEYRRSLMAEEREIEIEVDRLAKASTDIDPIVSKVIGATNGCLYRPLIGRLREYPIPKLRLNGGAGRLLDIGCGWGRWSFSASMRGYDVVGIDPSFGSILAARRVANQLGLRCKFLVADARYLPFDTSTFDTVFSYSVLQHFAAVDVERTLREVRRVLEPTGHWSIQMANTLGVRSLYHQLRRHFRRPTMFEVRYYSPSRLLRMFAVLGSCRIAVDGFFGLGMQGSDLLPFHYRAIVHCSDSLRWLSTMLPPLKNCADSLFVESL